MALTKKITTNEEPTAEERPKRSKSTSSKRRKSTVQDSAEEEVSSARAEYVPQVEATPEPEVETENETHAPETVEEEEYTTTDQILKALEREARIIRESESRRSKLLKKLRTLVRKETRKSRRSKSDKPVVKREQKKRPIIDALADLMGVSRGSEFSRGDVHSAICEYIKNNNLKSTDDKKCFELDDRLESVLGKPKYAAHNKNEDVRHSYNNLMKTLKDLFIPEEEPSQ